MEKQRFEEACAKFQAARDLDATATGTLLNLALCHEEIGRTATAWAEFRQVVAESTGKREDRVALAREHAAILDRTLPRIRIFVPPDARASGLRIRIDGGAPIAEASWGIELPVDPGAHELTGEAPHKRPRVVPFKTAASDHQTVVLDPLEQAPFESSEADRTSEIEGEASRRTRRVLGVVLAGTGVVALGVSGYFGLKASSDYHDATNACPNDVCRDQAAIANASSLVSSSKSAALAADIIGAVGGLLVLGGGVLFFTALGKKHPPVTTAWAF